MSVDDIGACGSRYGAARLRGSPRLRLRIAVVVFALVAILLLVKWREH